MHRRLSRALLGLVLLAAVVPGALPAAATMPGSNAARIVFTSDRTGNNDLFSMRPDGTDVKQLTSGTTDDIHPSVSPDGSRIAFSSNRSNGYDIWMMNADGSNQTRVTSNFDTVEIDPAWSPDGTKLAIMKNVGQQFDIFVIDANGQNPVNLTGSPDINEADISWAGDNSLIAFSSDEGGDFEIHTMRPDGTAKRQLTDNKQDDFLPDWAPDSKSIAFTTWRNENADIYEMDTDGSHQRPLVATKENETWASHSPDGRQLLFARQTGTRQATRSGLTGFLGDRNNDETDIKELFIYFLGFDFAIQMTEFDVFTADGGWIPTTFNCPVSEVEGYFEPVQGAWQDDDFFKQFDLTPNLLQVTPTEYFAQLPMVAGRKSLLFGVREPKNGPTRNDRYNIVIRGKVTGTTEVPVHMKFTELSNGNVIHTTTDRWKIKLDGPCGPPTEFQTVLEAPKGIPADAAFTFPNPGEYLIRNELIRSDGGPTGLQVDVGGFTVNTRGPRVLFVPLTVAATAEGDRTSLSTAASTLATSLAKRGPDYMPLAQGPGALPTSTRSVLDISRFLAERNREWKRFYDAPKDPNYLNEVRMARINQLFNFTVTTGRFDRVIAVLRPDQFVSLLGDDANGSTESGKVILAKMGVNQFTIGHEISHSQPYLWSSDEMLAECGFDYHNQPDNPVAHGFQITLDGVENRAPKDPFNHLMAANVDRWTDQCTYWHLIKTFQHVKDPPVILVQARLLNKGKTFDGELLPTYQFDDGEVDLDEKGKDDWAIVLRNASGKTLGRFPFTPEWLRSIEPEEVERRLITVLLRVPKMKGTDAIKLVGPKGTLDTIRYSDSPPKVTITQPTATGSAAAVEGSVNVSWKGADKDGGKLYYTLQYSSDDGESWTTELFETTDLSGSLPLEDVATHTVRVVVTDGSRSASDTVSFTTL